jgi:hypothetical protein
MLMQSINVLSKKKNSSVSRKPEKAAWAKKKKKERPGRLKTRRGSPDKN